MEKDRARAIIQNKDQILLIERNRSGDIYYVLPGGKIEDGESPETTVLREIKEETSVEVNIIKKLDTIVDKEGTVHHIFFGEYVSGTPSLSPDSPELTKESGIDVYTPMWVEIKKIKEIPMWPAEVKGLLINHFKL